MLVLSADCHGSNAPRDVHAVKHETISAVSLTVAMSFSSMTTRVNSPQMSFMQHSLESGSTYLE